MVGVLYFTSMAYMTGVSANATEEFNELKIEIGAKIIVTCGNICEYTEQVVMTFEVDEFNEFLKKAVQLIELEKNGKA